MNPYLDTPMKKIDMIMTGAVKHHSHYHGPVHVGVDLGTAYTVLVVLDENNQPVAGSFQFAQVVRDGLVVDFDGAVRLLSDLKNNVERSLGFELISAAPGYPLGVPATEIRSTAYVLNAAGLECTDLIDDPSAANNVLQISDGVIVDIGGGTTGIAVVKNSQVVYTGDEPTGGAHISLVIAGARNLTFEQAEEIKKDPKQQHLLFPMIRPVMEKVATIIQRYIEGYTIPKIFLVGGTSAYPGIAQVIEEYTGITTEVPTSPLFVTPLGIALNN